ncbi:large subunit ribosomal protein L25 [Paenacidovorax caeni]|jgi:large subunit ribosomal protein L25|uniref:Large ribosomal subunit protein bL25 n=1 Tax=Paenacidovorax caeni TaxID=343013 RepID=A0A1I7FYQ6_9BURK|nr:50S ribosomal protein L25/general stress protein Ctc [Paenacidovorax caeni]SFU41310.1 large subunit ribosomal protein L25 [Paenacidovorax caeni]
MKFVAFERTKQGTGASRRLRNAGKTTGIVYGGTAEPQAIELDHNALWHALKKEAFHSSILEMELAGQTSKVVLRDVQYHPFKQLVLHVDFQRVDDKTKIHLKVPLHFEGAENSQAVKVEGCTVTPLLHELDVVCMPSQLPEFIKVDLSQLNSKSTLGVQSIKLPSGVKAVLRGSNKNPALISIKLPEVVVDAAAAAAPAAAPAKKGKK